MWAALAPSLIGAGASILGGLIGKSGQDKANETNIELANTAYQRRVKDLQAAGLNPMLAYTQGGAQSPQIQNAASTVASSAQSAGNNIASINAARQMTAQTELTEAQTDLLRAQADDIIRRTRGEADIASAAGAVGIQSVVRDVIKRAADSDRAVSAATVARETYDAEITKARAEAETAAAVAKRAGGSADADIRLKNANAKLAELESSKQQVLKRAYELAEEMLPAAESGAKSIYEFGKRQWGRSWTDELRNYGRRK